MSHISREKLDLVNRTKKIIGQLESVLRGLNEDEQCADVLQRLAAARGAINSFMAELMGLRIAKRTTSGREQYTAYSSQDGMNWVRGGTRNASLGASARLALFAQNRSGFLVDFDYIHVFSLP
jgi:DNA-binding FrmR family transcriptional regulator